MRLPFLEETTPPPFYQASLSEKRRQQLDKWAIGERSQAYYLKRFGQIDKAGKLSPYWHWSAFLVTTGWLLYRKRYLDCFVYCVAGLSFVKLTIALALALLEFILIGHLPEAWQLSVRVGVGGAIWLFWAYYVGRWADAYYYRMMRREIADALVLYPNDLSAQKQYLQHHGGVSMLGLLVALSLLALLLGVIAIQFMPIVANKKEQAIIDDGYRLISYAKKQVERDYRQHGCPVSPSTFAPDLLTQDLLVQKSLTRHLTLDPSLFELGVYHHLSGVASDCVIVLRISNAGYPVRYLNGQTLSLYRVPNSDGVWRCQSSLAQSLLPVSCRD